MIEIVHHYTKAVLYTSESAADVRSALADAVRSNANLGGADLRDANLGGADLGGANLRDADLRGADLGGANLRDADLGGADLGGADLGGANLRGANLGGADLRDANLGGADLGGANLRSADLRGADLGGANLGGADLGGADLGDANLGGANLGGAYLRGADLRGADLGDANLGDLRAKLLGPDAPAPAELRVAVADHIESHPELHDQGTWGNGEPDPSCGTPCCVAGWACHLGGGDRGLGVATAATLLLHLDGAPTPSFDAGVSQEEILADLRAVPA